ncbi:FlaD/FlaE family flagellar protein [Halobaculum magnesiiphilum]|uniref:Flagella accessory C family protein n=1 Tax=Halobaculum magnesiiphilum TaxID=1017351 RepID=A0A8T8W9N6_9EURY|nr:FlaD/FlaE family flagellar protein [Halobaculum magnesiiphilum]QZP36541.1 flagella accessory C family protein [Halobaculum magnesiiphilum]
MGLLTALPGAGVGGIPGADATLLVSFGLLGASLLDRFRDGDDGPGDVDDGGDDLLGGDDGAFGGDGGGDDDDLGDLGGMDDWDDDDPFGGEDGGGDDGVAELEKRVDDLENEVASLSSTVNTVRSENEEISGKVEDMGEDVRSLLDIYEMVTRGINPFVDDVQGGGDLGGEGDFGLFDDAGGDGGDDEEDLDEDLASADAEGFFDEDLAGDGMDDLDEMDEGDDLDGMDDEDDLGDMEGMDEADGFDDDLDGFGDDDADDTDSDTMATDNGGGKSFSELKDEYESGDADWDEGEAPDDGEGDALDALDAEPESNGHDEAGDLGMGGEEEPEPDPDPAPESTAGPTDPSRRGEGVDENGGFEFVEEDDLSDEPDKPYLTSLPGDYVGDLMVMEWLEFLVEESTTTDAVRAVNYYERVEWIDEEVADQLKGFLSGFGDIDRNLMDRPGTDHLDLDHHTRSLKYIMQLTDATAESVVIDRWPQLSGGMHGPQR